MISTSMMNYLQLHHRRGIFCALWRTPEEALALMKGLLSEWWYVLSYFVF